MYNQYELIASAEFVQLLHHKVSVSKEKDLFFHRVNNVSIGFINTSKVNSFPRLITFSL